MDEKPDKILEKAVDDIELEDDLGEFDLLLPEDDELEGLDLDFLSEEVDKEVDKKGQSTRMRQIANYPQGYFAVTFDFEGNFEVTRLDPDEVKKRKHEPNVFDNWSKLKSKYINTCRRKRKLLMETVKRIENYHLEFAKKEEQ